MVLQVFEMLLSFSYLVIVQNHFLAVFRQFSFFRVRVCKTARESQALRHLVLLKAIVMQFSCAKLVKSQGDKSHQYLIAIALTVKVGAKSYVGNGIYARFISFSPAIPIACLVALSYTKNSVLTSLCISA